MTIRVMDIKPRQVEIIEAAGKLLTVFGISGLTIKNIATEMNFSESAIYRHFSSKEEILIILLQYLNNNITNILDCTLETDDYDQNFIFFFRYLAQYFNDNPHYVVAVFSEGLMDESEAINNNIIELMSTFMDRVQKLVEDGQKRDLITQTLTSNQIAKIIIPTFRHQMFEWKLSNFSTDVVENIDSLSKSLLKLLELRK